MAGQSVLSTQLSAADKISRAKIQLYIKQPFFSYLIEFLKLREEPDEKIMPTMGVDRYANCIYNPKFIDTLSDAEMQGVLCHEVIHLAYKHPDRGKGRHITVGPYNLWNVAVDIVDNYVVMKNGLQIPKMGILPNIEDTGSINILGTQIDDIENKSAEEIYELLKESLKDQIEKQKGKKGKGKGTPVSGLGEPGDGQGFDVHDFDKKEDGTDPSDPNKGDGNGLPNGLDWDGVTNVAANIAKQRGTAPLGMGREFEVFDKGYINWRNLIARKIASLSPNDYCWSRPDRRLIGMDIYMPHITGETTKVLIGIDTSGSVSRDELSKFMTEIVSLAKSFDGVEVRIITHDAEVHDDYHVSNGNIQKILALDPKGGGGTDHVPLYDYIHTHGYDKGNNMLFSFTDGYSNYPENPCIDTLFILAGNYSVNAIPQWHRGIIELLD